MTITRSRITTYPSHASGSIALLAALCATGFSTSQPLQLTIVGIEAIGAFILLGSSVVQQRGRRMSGLALLLAGSIIVCLALGLGVVFPVGLLERSALLSGIVGPVLVVLAMYPLRATWSRSLTGLGTILLISGVMIRGWLAQIDQIPLLGAVLMTILAWDAAEQAITLGDDVGRGARTFVVSIAHTLSSLAIGLLAITVATGIYGMAPVTIPLGAVALLLSA